MLSLPDEWVRAGYALRRARGRDRAFQRALFATARADAHLIALWPPAERDAFYNSQFALQDVHYRRFYADADAFIVTRHAASVGRLIVERGKQHWQVIDISLMPDVRGRGLGTALLRAVQAACAAAGAETLGLQVEFGNRARLLYARLGFVEIENSGAYIAMAWKPAGQLKTAS